MRIQPCELRDANAFIRQHHRHHKPTRGHRFSIRAVDDQGEIVGVIVVGRPVARHQQDGVTVEITRLCVNGHRNACSFLIGAARRAAVALGYRRMISYTLIEEPGTAWVAAGMCQTGIVQGGLWTGLYGPGLKRKNEHPTGPKRRWEINL